MAEKTSRREFLATSGAVALAGAAGLGGYQRPAGGKLFAYVGRWTSGPGFGQGGDGGITVFTVSRSDGSLTQVSRTGMEADKLNSDGLCVSADGQFLYSIDLTPTLGGVAGAGGGVAAFAIDRENGSLKYLNNQPSMGANPTSVIIDKNNSRVVVANHGAFNKIVVITKRNGVPVIENPTDDGTIALFPVKADGSLEPACDVAVFEKRAPGDNGPGAASHMAIFDRTEKWVIASDNGYDHIYVYPFSPTSRTLGNGKSFATPQGKAPRHLVFHPRASYFFMTNEREASVSSFYFDSNTGEVRPVQTATTTPQGYSGPRVSPSNIRMHPSGKFIYVANRGDESIAALSIDEGSGRMTLIDTAKTGGRGAREMNVDPSGRFIYMCSVFSNDVVTFAIDLKTGKLTQTAKLETPRAAAINFATL